MDDSANLVHQEYKLHEVLSRIIQNLEDNERHRPWEFEAEKKRQLVEKKIRRLRAILQELEYLAPWTAGRDMPDPNRAIAARQEFMGRHSHFINDPFLPYPSSDSSSDEDDIPRRIRHTTR